MKHFRRLLADTTASATIELAFIAPIIATMVIGVIDLSMAYSHKLNLEQAAQRALEKVKLTTTVQTVDATLKAEAALAAGVSEDAVTVSYVLECDGVPETDYDIDCDAGEVETRYLEIEITDAYEPVIDPDVIGLPNTDGKFPMTVTTGVRTY